MADYDNNAEQGGEVKPHKLYDSICSAIGARNRWENRLIDYYRMRHAGLRRQKLPWPNATDLHWPLIDTNIEKLKPLFFQQVVGMDVLATFVPMRSQLAAATTTIEQWFDYKVREKSNLQDEALSWIDYALMAGRGVLKVYWDNKKRAVQFESIDPLYFIVPAYTRDLQDADWCVHVMTFSKEAYKRRGIWKSDEETVKRLCGDLAAGKDPGQNSAAQAKQLREGLTHSDNKEKIIVWEVYERQPDSSWRIHTFSPMAPDIPLRETIGLLYEHGMVPFVDFAYEVKDKGWYSPRGVAEMLAPFEAALCHTWNQKHDSMALFNKPLFRAEREVPNTANLRLNPGGILPYGIVPATMGTPPINFDDEMTLVRSVAEQRVANPDFGMGQVINTQNRRTATEIEAINTQSMQSGDLRARIFRLALGRLYRQAYRLLLQFDKDDLQYRFLEDSLQLDPQVLHGQYHIEPKGGVNEVNRQFLLQKAVQRKQIFGQSPWINQAELDRTILELDDPSLVKRVFTDPNLKGQQEAADEAKGIPALLMGYPLPVLPGQDYPGRIQVLLQYLQSVQAGQNILPPQQQLVPRLMALLDAYETMDTNGARQMRGAIEGDLQRAGLLPGAAPLPA